MTAPAAHYNKEALNWLLALLNDNYEEFAPNGQKLKLTTFDKEISPDLLIKIVTFILNILNDELDLPKFEFQSSLRRLTKLEEIGLSDAAIFTDASLDRLYQNLKGLYPEGDDSLSFKIFIKPKPSEVKEALSYLAQLLSFVHTNKNSFYEIVDEIETNSAGQKELFEELERVKEELNGCFNKLEDWKGEVPEMEEKLKDEGFTLNDELLEIQEIQEKLKLCMQENEREERFFSDLEKNLQMGEKQLESLKAQIVDSPETIVQNLIFEKQRLESITIKREEMGKVITGIGKEEVNLNEAVNEAEGMICQLNDLVMELGQLVEETQDFSKFNQCISKMNDQITSIENNIKRSRVQIETIRAEAEAAKGHRNKELKVKVAQKEKIKREIKSFQQAKQKAKEIIEVVKEEIKMVRKEILISSKESENIFSMN